jgi:radical SAM superfamily enzyme YgiQ (UPF0313 family)
MYPGNDMRILLISANTEPFPEMVFPIGLVYVANALQRAGVQARIFDMRHNNTRAALKKELKTFYPDRIGISLRNVDNAAYPSTSYYLPTYLTLVRSLRSLCEAPIILGGSAFSLFPEEIFEYLGTQAGVMGDGEGVLEVFRNSQQGKIVFSDRHDLEDTSFPKNIAEIFPGFLRYRTIGIQTARGCPNRCIYCTYPCLEGRTIRTRSPACVAEEIAFLHKDFNLRDFFIVDSLFNADEEHMVQVAEKIVDLNLQVRISCYLQPRTSDPGIFHLLKKAGFVAIDFGTDSGSPAMLESLKKPFGIDDIIKASRACDKAGIDFCHSLILGGPGETSDTIRVTVNLMDKISPRAIVAMTGIRIYPDTQIEQTAIEEGALKAGGSLLDPKFYFSGMGPSKLLRCAYDSTSGRRNWFFPGKRDWGSAVGFKVLHFLYRRGPLWRVFRR